MRSIVVGSRGSQLALRQTREVIERLERLHTGISWRIEVVRTTGDRLGTVPLTRIGETGLFVKEIEQALIEGRIDLAVHSAKDLPSAIDPSLCVAAYPARENPADALVSQAGTLAQLPVGARVGTGSVRRKAQLLRFRPDLDIVDLRGNLDTRLAKLDRGEYDAIVVALAGLSRMGWRARATEILGSDVCLPAPGQGALALECRVGDPVCGLVRPIDDAETRACVNAERAFLAELGAGCRTPVAALAVTQGDRIRLDALVAAVDGSRVVRRTEIGDPLRPEELGMRLAGWFVQSSARELLEDARGGGAVGTMGAP
ncbi:MAG: hydroxymethylbilane synthase [Armatimonadota bacterium]